jgi:hypothetical protein
MKWCCAVFEGAFLEAGRRGLAVVVDRDQEGSPEFILQHRVVDAGGTPPRNSNQALTLTSDTRIEYCPWCGSRLATFYRGRIDDLARPGLKVELPLEARTDPEVDS